MTVSNSYATMKTITILLLTYFPSYALITPTVRTGAITRSVQHIYDDKCSDFTSQGLFAQKRNTNSDFFPEAGSQYVPSGLTAKEYAKIKGGERKKRSKMDFGAWGPRFSRSARPDGDWMTQSSLWTSGFTIGTQEPINGDVGKFTRGREFILQMLPSYLLSMILIESLCTASYLMKSKIPTTFSTLAVAVLQLQKKNKAALLLNTTLFTRVVAIKVSLGLLFLAPARMIITRFNRRMLWSPRRTIVVSTLTSFGLLSVWAFILAWIGGGPFVV